MAMLWSSEDVACATAIRVMRGYDDPVGSVRLPQLRPLEGASVSYFPITEIDGVNALPMTVKILLEGLVRAAAQGGATPEDVAALAAYPAKPPPGTSVPFRPARILLQDYTGVPAALDLAAMRAAMQRAGRDPARIEPLVPVDLIIDHSVQADFFGASDVYERNLVREYERNRERYALLRWAGQAFKAFNVVPPGAGICHQVNLERLSRVVQVRDGVALPDTLFGADSHTTMVNGLGVLGWGVGGIEAEAAMLGQPTYLPWPVVVGVRLTGALPIGTTATDLVLTLTEKMRQHGVVDKFVEFSGDGLSSLTVADRATVSNMCPEYGATAAFFPVDAQSLRYLTQTGRGDLVDLVERYTKAQGLFRIDGAPAPRFDETIEVDLGSVRPSVAGPKRPQDRVELHHAPRPHRRPEAAERRAADAGRAGDGRDRGRRATRADGRWRGRRLRRGSGDHVVHEHVEPVGDDRGGAPREESGGARADGEAAREDDARARLARRDALSRQGRPDAVSR